MITLSSAANAGTVIGPSGAPTPGTVTDNAVVRWDGTTGTLVQNGIVTEGDNGLLSWIESNGEAITATNFQIGRDNDSPNQMHFNVPSGNGYEWSIADVAKITLNNNNLTYMPNNGSAGFVLLDSTGTTGTPIFRLSTTVLTGGNARNWIITTNYDVAGDLTWRCSNVEGGDAYGGSGTTVIKATSAGLLKVSGGVQPFTDNGASLGSTSFQWSNLFLASGGVINWNNANVTITQAASALTLTSAVATSGSPTLLTLTGAAHTTLTASTEDTGFLLDFSATKQFATGALTTQREIFIKAPTYKFVGASTISNAATFYISNSPQQGTNATITNAYTIWSDAGNNRFDGNVGIGNVTGTTNGYLLEVGDRVVSSIIQSPASSYNGIIVRFDGTGSHITICDNGGTTGQGGILCAGNVLYFGSWSNSQLNFRMNNTDYLLLNAGVLTPASNDGTALGTSSLMFSDLFLASGGVINWNNGDVTATHSTNTLAFAGASSGYTFDATITDTSGINFGGTTLANYVEGTFSPTVTLVGGAGNTVPQYSTNTGRYTRIGNRVFVDIYLTGDGGNEGAGTGQVNIALPITASASHPTSFWPCGYADNGATEYEMSGQIVGSGTTIQLIYFTTISGETNFTGADQNNTTRTVRLKFSYEV